MTRVTLTVNGHHHTATSPSDTPLLYVLRDELALNSPRYGCGKEQCGACRVIVDGELAYACTVPVEAVNGADIMTVEGMTIENEPPAKSLHPLQRAFLEFNAAQCGYCSSGILMAAWKLLQQNLDPTRDEIADALDGNLCRCGAHNRILEAVASAARQMRSEK